MKKIELDQFSYHEAIDRIHTITNMIELLLIEHDVCQQHDELMVKVEAAQALLVEVYQQINNIPAYVGNSIKK